MVNFHTVGHVSDSPSIALKLISDEGHLMAALNKALSQLVAMSLNPSKLGKGEVSTYENTVLSIRPDLLNF